MVKATLAASLDAANTLQVLLAYERMDITQLHSIIRPIISRDIWAVNNVVTYEYIVDVASNAAECIYNAASCQSDYYDEWCDLFVDHMSNTACIEMVCMYRIAVEQYYRSLLPASMIIWLDDIYLPMHDYLSDVEVLIDNVMDMGSKWDAWLQNIIGEWYDMACVGKDALRVKYWNIIKGDLIKVLSESDRAVVAGVVATYVKDRNMPQELISEW